MSTGIPQRRRWNYSVRALLIFVVTISLVLGYFLTARRLRIAEAELGKLRNEAGYLTITDRSLVHAIALETNEPNMWRWRLFIPKGRRYAWRVAQKDIPRDGVPKHGISGVSNEPYWDRDNEVLVTAILTHNERGGWRLSVTSRIGDSKNQMAGAATEIPESEMQWMSQIPCTDGRVLGSHDTEKTDPRGPIILLQRRACEQFPDGTFQPSAKPRPGFAIWLEKI